MIYVLVASSGFYEDYREINVFASLSKDKVEARKAEEEKNDVIYRKASEELAEFRESFKETLPYPERAKETRAPIWNDASKRWELADSEIYKKAMAKYHDTFHKAIQSKAKELKEQYKINWDPTTFYEGMSYRIDEVESD